MRLNSQTQFERIGRVLHLRIENAADLERVLDIDESHWVAISAPVESFRCDPVFLSWVDADQDGRLRVMEIKNAIRWLRGHLKDEQSITARSDRLHLDHIDPTTPDGERILQQARKILARLDKSQSNVLTLKEIRLVKEQAQQAQVSEAGVALPEAAQTQRVGDFMRQVVIGTGGAAHPSGTRGVGQAQLDRFIQEAQTHLAWLAHTDQARRKLENLGASLEAGYDLYLELADKLDSYFTQCLAMAHDPAYASRWEPTPEQVAATDFSDRQAVLRLLRRAPLAPPCAERVLRWEDAINPVFASQIHSFRKQVLEPLNLADPQQLTPACWEQVKAAFEDYHAWRTRRLHSPVAQMPVAVLEMSQETELIEATRQIIASSQETAVELEEIRLVEKLVLYSHLLIDLTNNFVSFPHLYDPNRRALFEHGSLVMDGRHFNMAIRVKDRATHIQATKQSDIFVIYIQVTHTASGSPVTGEFALPVTAEGKGNLCVGKRGIFYDLEGREYDAIIVHMIDNPVSLAEALISPFQRIGKMIGEKIEQMTGSAEKKLDAATQATLSAAGSVAAPKQAAATSSGSGVAGTEPGARSGSGAMIAGGVFAAGGVALAAVGSTLAYITKIFMDYGFLKPLGGLAGAMIAVLIPVAIMAMIKLRRRDLSSLLEGAGWAINARMRLTRQQALHFSQRPGYPKGVQITDWLWWGLLAGILGTTAWLLSLN